MSYQFECPKTGGKERFILVADGHGKPRWRCDRNKYNIRCDINKRARTCDVEYKGELE